MDPAAKFAPDRAESDVASGGGSDADEAISAQGEEDEEEAAAGDDHGPGKPEPFGALRDWSDDSGEGYDDPGLDNAVSQQPAAGAGAKRKMATEQAGTSGKQPAKKKARLTATPVSVGDPPSRTKKSKVRKVPEATR